MQLPQNFFWITGYENRYAMFYDVARGELLKAVYSFVYPGCQGKPMPIAAKSNGNYYLSKGGWKEGYHYSVLQDIVRKTEAFRYTVKSKASTTTFAQAVNAHNSSANVRWIIGTETGGALSMSSMPRQHETEDSAYAEAERLATTHPGKTFIVFKAVRKVVVGGVQVTDL